MALYYGRHKVADYDTWRPYFDGDQPRIAAAGAKVVSVMRSVDDPNNVHFVFDIPDFNAFMGLMQSEETQTAMRNGGVQEAPSIYMLQELQQN
jgi:hypothetical protein